jgi:tetratricopeptide (TPR) repeat protein
VKQVKKKKFKLPRQIAKLKAEADNLYIFGRRSEAKVILADIIKKYPDYEDAYRLYGLICLDEQNKKVAANFMIMASKQKNPANHKNWISIAHLLREEENYELAALYFGKALKSDANNVEIMQFRLIKYIHFNRVQCFEKIGEFRKAIKELIKMRILAHAFQLRDLLESISRKLAFVSN